MKPNGLTVEWTLDLRGRNRRPVTPANKPASGKLPRVTRLMALAIKFQEMVDRGEVRDYADLARLGYVTRARMTQVMNLLKLAPDIQEHILFLTAPSMGRHTVSERVLRGMTAITPWPKQRELWQPLSHSRCSY
jgi:hypothetical protein